MQIAFHVKMVKILLGFFLFIAMYSCTEKQHPPVSFYYWKQSFELSKPQMQLLQSCGTKRLYVKFFDVVLDGNQQIKPISKIDFQSSATMEVVPCVFIQNAVFEHHSNTSRLAEKMAKLILGIAANKSLNVKEIQIDCDWTKGTKSAYFSFLEALQAKLGGIDLACTIRLHQIKYQESSGIPPVKKGLLMCYNMDDIDDVTTTNSIVSSKVLKQYVNENTAYPLPLDLALPIFQWGLVFRLGKLSVIANDLSVQSLKHADIKQIGEDSYLVQGDVTIDETNLCKGDLIRFESSSSRELFKIAKILKETKLTFEQLIYYHISQEHTHSYHANTLSAINRLIP
jgi:hypothetical protein